MYNINNKTIKQKHAHNIKKKAACMTYYLLKTPKEKVNLVASDHETAFLRFVSEINSDLMVELS